MLMSAKSHGFTLIELSIVLVIIGLLVGGVLVGQDLIKAAYIRAQISQIEKFNTAVNTFYGKFQGLPGDLNASVAQSNGLTTRSGTQGDGDSNGLLETYGCGSPNGVMQGGGEKTLFFIDLTTANGQNLNLIEGSFSVINVGGANYTVASMPIWFPAAKIGNGNYIYVYSWNGVNYFGLSEAQFIGSCANFGSGPGLSVQQAYRIDLKTDDGYPQSGRVTTAYTNDSTTNTSLNALGGTPAWTGLGGPTATSCYDNGGGGSAIQYTNSYQNGANLNCALSFRMQAGD